MNATTVGDQLTKEDALRIIEVYGPHADREHNLDSTAIKLLQSARKYLNRLYIAEEKALTNED